jgi:probable HAF family extracellular repeat protein
MDYPRSGRPPRSPPAPSFPVAFLVFRRPASVRPRDCYGFVAVSHWHAPRVFVSHSIELIVMLNLTFTHPHCSALGFASLMTMGLFFAGAAQAQKYTVTELPKLAGGTFATATAINNADQVVGYADDASGNYDAIIWNDGRVAALSPGDPLDSSASGINDAGVVVGEATGAFVWSPTFVGNSGYQVSDASGINAHGEIVGEVEGHPAVWATPTMMGVAFSSLNPLPGNFSAGAAPYAINGSGVIVGVSQSLTNDLQFHATRWSSSAADAKVKDLGTLGGLSSQPNAVNDRGWIVGWAQIGNGRQHAALWEPTTTAFDLGTLGGKNGSASGINIRGDIVGSAQTVAGVWHAVLWTSKHFKAVDLNTEISPTLAKTIMLVDAVGTNNSCRIVVNGIDRQSGANEVFLLTPTDQATCTSP